MTDSQKELCIDFWKLNDLDGILAFLEDSFGNHIVSYKSAVDYTNILINSYAHAIIVMKEIVCLLKNGFPDGALARSRRIYEQMIVLAYFEVHKNDADFSNMVERYHDSQNVKAYHELISWYEFFKQKDKKDKTEQLLAQLNQKYKEIKKQCNGTLASKLYWWTGNPATSFDRLSACFDDPFTKILYRRACISVHAGAMNDAALLGRDNPNGNMIYTGATYYGFSIPLLLSVASFSNMTDIVFCNFQIDITEQDKLLTDLIHFYMANMAE